MLQTSHYERVTTLVTKMKKTVWYIMTAFIVANIMATAVSAAQGVPSKVLSSVNSVVRIIAEYTDGQTSGSGFVIAQDKDNAYIVTNNHVVEGNPYSISVWISATDKPAASVVLASDHKDLCILKVAGNIGLKPLIINKNTPAQGDAIYAVGFPGAADYLSDESAKTSSEATITEGIISAIRQASIVASGKAVGLLQITAAINHGNSGGPLFDKDGQVVGVNTFIANDSQGIFAAVASSELLDFIGAAGISVSESQAVPYLLIAGIVALVGLIIGLCVSLAKGTKKKKENQAKISLKQYITSNGPLSVTQAVNLLLPFIISIKDKHDKDEVCLKINPENIYVSDNTATYVPQSQNDQMQYLDGYKSPELYRGKSGNISSDIYAICAVLYYAIFGTEPENAIIRENDTNNGIEKRQVGHLITNENEILFHSVLKGMSVNSEYRYNSLNELITLLIPYYKKMKTETPVDTTEKSHGKKKKKPLIPITIVAVIVLIIGGYLTTYLLASSKADDGDFLKADNLLLVKPVTGLHDKKLIEYVNAGVKFENRHYEEAEQAFISLDDYKNSREMAVESRYRLAGQLTDLGKYDEAISIYSYLFSNKIRDCYQEWTDARFRSAVNDLYQKKDYSNAERAFLSLSFYENYKSKASEMLNETRYCWAVDLITNEEWIQAYKKISELDNYKDSDEIKTKLKDVVYLEGVSAYHDKDYDDVNQYYHAAACFSAIHPYRDSEKYIALINARKKIYSDLGNEIDGSDDLRWRTLGGFSVTVFINYEQIYKALRNIFSFEDAADILLKSTLIAQVSLKGNWTTRDGQYYFYMNANGRASYNLPWFDNGNSAKIINGDYILFHYGKESTARKLFHFDFVTEDSVLVYCYKDGSSYMLYKQ